jgi:hypothetical protein
VKLVSCPFAKKLTVRKFALFFLMILSVPAYSQLVVALERSNVEDVIEVPGGSVSGQVKTTDGEPVTFFTVYIKETGKTTVTDKNGSFGFRLNYYVHENYSINPIPPAQFVGTISYKF